jgi:uncharacterized protein (TIGR00251 family)
MRLNIRVVPNAKKSRAVLEPGRLKIYLTAPAVDGKANKALIEFLAEYYDVKRSAVKLVLGEKSRDKVVAIVNQGG